MEFKFRAGDDRPSEYIPSPPSSFGYFYDQAMRAGYSSSNPVRNLETILWREMEKDRIREEVIVEEIARRRLLETEVGREMAMRFAGQGGGEEKIAGEQLPVEERLKIPVALANQFVDCRWLEERLAFFRNRRMMFDHLHQFLLHQEAVVQPLTTPSTKDSKDKLIFPTSCTPNLFGGKRKAATSPDGGAGELPVSGLAKKHKSEWSCALCHVSVGSERAMNEHLEGRKHKAKKAGLRGQKCNTAPLPKAANAANIEPKVKAEEVLMQANDSHNSSEKIEKKGENNGMSVGQNQHAKSLKKNEVEILQKEGRTMELKQTGFKFWCEMCKIGAYSEVVMEAHKNGKKHRARLQGLGHNGEAARVLKSMAEEGNKREANDSKTVAEEGKEEKAAEERKEGKANDSKTVAEEGKEEKAAEERKEGKAAEERKEGKAKDLEMAAEETKEMEKGPEVTILEETNWEKPKETARMYEETKKAKDSADIAIVAVAGD